MKKNKNALRRGVCGIFLSTDGRILLGERLREKGHWQLPQGGMKKHETPIEALKREILEETGISKIIPILRTKTFIPYFWPREIALLNSYLGQEHIYFLLNGEDIDPKMLGSSEEFSRFGWFTIDQVLSEIIDYKITAYLKAFDELGLRPYPIW